MSEQSAIDRRLIELYGRKTPEEIAEETGLSAQDVMRQTASLIKQRNYLGEDAKLALLLERMDGMTREVEERLGGMDNKDISKALNATSASLYRTSQLILQIRKENQVDVEEMRRRFGAELVKIVEMSFNRYLGKLQERFPGVDADAMEMEFREIIAEVAEEYEE